MLVNTTIVTTSYMEVAMAFQSALIRSGIDFTLDNVHDVWTFEIMNGNRSKWEDMIMEVISLLVS